MDKRALTRTSVPGTQIQLRRLGKRNLFNPLSGPFLVCNLSKSGLCFQSDVTIDSGEAILMKLTFPDGNSLRLKGKVRWYKEKDHQTDYNHGVQFFPFGHNSKYNHPNALNYLRQIDGQMVSSDSSDNDLGN